jgi:hypothetical protein
VLDALNDAAEALRTAYPMLERIAYALAVDEIQGPLVRSQYRPPKNQVLTELLTKKYRISTA